MADGEAVTIQAELVALEGIVADFTVDVTGINVGGTVHFTDNSWGAQLVSWDWEFEGGTPATSTAVNPTVTYNTAGTYSVRLTVTNADGESATKFVPNMINVVSAFNMHDGEEHTCGAIFYDNGGPNGQYTNNLNMVLTIYPDTEGGIVQVEFQSFELESNYDFLYIYDGTSVSATQIGQYTGNSSPGVVTATNAAGALTFKLTSDTSVTKEGWVAYVSCLGVSYPLEVTAYAEHETVFIGETNTLVANAIGGTGNYTYTWTPADHLDDATSQNPVFTATEAGEFIYIVTVSDGEESLDATVTFTVLDPTDVDEIAGTKVSVYPNPASSTLNINVANGFTSLNVKFVNIHGQIVKEVSNALEINVSDVESGIYFIKIDCDGQQYLQKIVIK